MKASVLSYSLALTGISIVGILSSVNFDYTGGEQTFPLGFSVNNLLIGPRGTQAWSGTSQNGLGGFTNGTLNVQVGKTLWLQVERQGTQSNGNQNPGDGGFNDGGNGSSKRATVLTPCCLGGAGGASDVGLPIDDIDFRDLVASGGGASDVRLPIDDLEFRGLLAVGGAGVSGARQLVNDLDFQDLVADGDGTSDVGQLIDDIDFQDLVAGGGDPSDVSQLVDDIDFQDLVVDGGGLVAGNDGSSSSLTGGTGGTQSAGGSNSNSDQSGSATTDLRSWVGGGGSSWYGGGTSSANFGGGSNYFGGVTGGSIVQGDKIDNGFLEQTIEAEPVSVPAPSTLAILALGLFGLVSRKVKKSY